MDGAQRVFTIDEYAIHPNNHMLYPVHMKAYLAILGTIGYNPSGMSLFYACSYLNMFAASLSLVVLFLIGKYLQLRDEPLVLSLAFLLFSKSFLINAINPNEPMLGFLFSVLSVYFALRGVLKRSLLQLVLSGFFISYAMATYQSMFAWFPGVCIVVSAPLLRKNWKEGILYLGTFCGSVALSILVIYGLAYSISFGSGPVDILDRLFATGVGRSGMWGLLTPKKIILLPLSFQQAIYSLPFQGFRSTFLGGQGIVNAFLYLTAACITLLGILSLRLNINRAPSRGLSWVALLLFSVFFVPSAGLTIYWIANYTKIWLQPLASLALLLAYLLSSVESPWLPAKRRGIILAVTLLALWNTSAFFYHNQIEAPNRLQTIKRIDKIVPGHSFIVMDWTQTTKDLSYLYPRQRQFKNLVTAWVSREVSVETYNRELQEFIADGYSKDHEVYILGDLIGMDRSSWDAFLGTRGKLPYESLDWLRESAVLVNKDLKIYKISGADLESLSEAASITY